MDRNFEFVSQTQEHYKVRSASGQVIDLPKLKSSDSLSDLPLAHDFHLGWLKISAIGLPLGGILSVIFAPLVIWKVGKLIREENLNLREIIYSKNLLISSVIIFGFGIIFFSLFIIHLIF